MQAFELAQLKEDNISLIRIESSHTNPKKGTMGSGAKGGVKTNPKRVRAIQQSPIQRI